MAKKADFESVADARRENQREGKKFKASETENPDPVLKIQGPAVNAEEKKQAGSNFSNPGPTTLPPVEPVQEPVKDEFREQYENYFKDLGGFGAGEMVLSMLDGLKADFLWLYCKKHKIEGVTKEALAMDPKAKKFAAFLVDSAVKNNFFDWIKKYPLPAAGIVFALSGGATYLTLQMLKKSNDEAKKQAEENKKLQELVVKLQKEKQDRERGAAEETEFVEVKSKPKKKVAPIKKKR